MNLIFEDLGQYLKYYNFIAQLLIKVFKIAVIKNSFKKKIGHETKQLT